MNYCWPGDFLQERFAFIHHTLQRLDTEEEEGRKATEKPDRGGRIFKVGKRIRIGSSRLSTRWGVGACLKLDCSDTNMLSLLAPVSRTVKRQSTDRWDDEMAGELLSFHIEQL